MPTRSGSRIKTRSQPRPGDLCITAGKVSGRDRVQQAASVRALNARLQDLRVRLNGDRTIASRSEPVPLSVTDRIRTIAGGSWESQSDVTGNYRDSFEIAARQFPPILADLKAISIDLIRLEDELEAEGAPWTSARLPEWPSQ